MISNTTLRLQGNWILISIISGTLLITLVALIGVFFYKNDAAFSKENNISTKFYSNNKFPYMALLNLYRDNDTITCGGTLIDDTHILTAAHCVYGAYLANIWLGTSDLNNLKFSKKLKSNCFAIHKYYNNVTYQHDIALIYLNEKVILDGKINSVRLSAVNDLQLFYESPQYAVGWGLNNPDEGLNSILKNKSVQIVNSRFCSLSAEDDYSIICALRLSTDGPCHGDSGGPLLRNEKSQVGIVSRGDFSCNLSNPTVFTAVRFYTTWINDNLLKTCK